MLGNNIATESGVAGQQIMRQPMAAAAKILLVEDDGPLASVLERAIIEQGYAVVCAPTGAVALEALAEERFDAVLLDIGLPDIDGFEVLGRMDPARKFAVLIISAYDRVEQRVRGLDLGADDYLVKPFAIEEMEARLRALLRRSKTHNDQRIVLAGLSVDLGGKRAWVNAAPLELTAREWRVLLQLLLRVGQVVSKEQLQQALGGEQPSLSDNAIEVYVSRLRAKLTDSGVNIRTLRGFGYMVDEPPAPERMA